MLKDILEMIDSAPIDVDTIVMSRSAYAKLSEFDKLYLSMKVRLTVASRRDTLNAKEKE